MTSRIATWHWKQWFLTVATSATAGVLVGACEGTSNACSFVPNESGVAPDSPDTGQYGDFTSDAADDARTAHDASDGGGGDAKDDVVTDGATNATGD